VVLNAWPKGLASGDQRRPTGSGSALETLRDDALYKFTLLTYLHTFDAFAGYAQRTLCFHYVPLFQHGLVCRAGESITHDEAEASYDHSWS